MEEDDITTTSWKVTRTFWGNISQPGLWFSFPAMKSSATRVRDINDEMMRIVDLCILFCRILFKVQ